MVNKEILREVTYGMYIVSCKDKDQLSGCVINTLCQITSDPIQVSISLNKENKTYQSIVNKRKFSTAILSQETSNETIQTFGFYNSKDHNKFANTQYKMVDDTPVVTDHICGYLICEVEKIIDCGSHSIFLAKVVDAKKENSLEPMTYQYYHQVRKGKAPKKAPTYQTEIITQEESYVCDTCGYVHEGPLPDDFVCPICGKDRTHFKRVEKK